MSNKLKHKISQLFICKTPDSFEEIEKFILEGIGGFMIGKGGEIATSDEGKIEGDSEKSLKKFVSIIKKLSKKNNELSLFLAIDGEGGKYFNRFKNFSEYKSPRFYGKKFERDYDLKYFVCEVEKYARLMKQIGINMNFAPLIDVSIKGYKGYIAEEKILVRKDLLVKSEILSSNRSYSDNKKTVNTLAIASMKVFQDNDIIPTLKHFLTYGILKKSENPHFVMPIIDLNKKELNEHIDNYRKAFLKGAYAIMSGHIMTVFDKNMPVSLSKKTYKFIRNELRFKGLIITDELNMGSIRRFYNGSHVEIAAIDAVYANDMILISRPKTFLKMRDAIYEVALKNKKMREVISDRYKRIIRYKKKIGIIN
ncbi:glycoside hydrolase family 3 protein [Candidatus Pacearchaeota archaeon]|nr:glycoside hydrolase family 3 protein [Candidatus Pacearchaeota archaeon]